MKFNYCFTAAEDHLLLALRDQGHYNWDFIVQITGRGEWALKQRHYILHKGLRRMEPRGRGKIGLHNIRNLRMSKVPHGWMPQKDEELQMLHFQGHDWLEIAYKLPPYNGPECLARWLSLNPEAKYPYKTEMDFRWKFEDVKKLVSMKKGCKSWEEMAKAIPWDVTNCRKYWYSHFWFAFNYWFPDGRNFRDQPQFWHHKVPEQQERYKSQGQNIKSTAEPGDKDRKEGRERGKENKYLEKTKGGQVEHKADLNGNESLGDNAALKNKDAEGENDDEHMKEIRKGRDRNEEIVEGADNSRKKQGHKDDATRPEVITTSQDAKTSKE